MKKVHIFLSMVLMVLLCLSTNDSNAQNDLNKAVKKGKIQYPYEFKYEGNPLSRIHGAADPSVHVWGDTIWMYTSQDHEGGYKNMDGYHAWSTTDLTHWTDHGDVFNSSMLDTVAWGKTPSGWMWAPGAARKKDENGIWQYYLYYPHNPLFKGETWVTGVAIASSAAGPFTDLGPLREGKMGMDPMVFIDDDGQAYIHSNSHIVARLKPNMIELAEKPRKVEYAPKMIASVDTLRYCEGSYMHKKDGKYYFSYSNWKNSEFQGFYAIGDSPYGPFKWEGAMAPAPRGAQDHHSIIEFKDQWYYFYHIALPDIPAVKDGQSRIVCFDKLYHNEDGTIQTVQHTGEYRK